MKRSQFDHTIRAAGSILGESEVLVIGSQAVHGSLTEVPPQAERSIEVDIAALDDAGATKADLIDGSIGEASLFHRTFGYYAEGVSETTAVLPPGWKGRLVRYESPMAEGAARLGGSERAARSPDVDDRARGSLPRSGSSTHR
jgi:hypothetical protein